MLERGATLAHLALARNEIKEMTETSTSDDPLVRDALWFVTRRIEELTSRELFPRVRVEYVDGYGEHIDESRGILYLPKPLLSLTSITVSGTTWTVNTDFYLQPRNGQTPITALRAVPGKSWGSTGDDWQESIVITGIWGYRSNYSSAWYSPGETVPSGGLTSSATSFTASDANGIDAMRRTPRYAAGMLLRFGGSELAAVLETDYGSNETHLRRGMFGSTATAHEQGATVEIFEPDPIAIRAALRWASYLYKRRGQFNKTTTEIDGVTVVTFPEDAPEEVLNEIGELRNDVWTVV